MKKKILATVVALSLAMASTSVFARGRSGALVGALIGATAGLMIGQAQAGPRGTVPGALIGAFAGATIGSAATTSHYRRARSRVYDYPSHFRRQRPVVRGHYRYPGYRRGHGYRYRR